MKHVLKSFGIGLVLGIFSLVTATGITRLPPSRNIWGIILAVIIFVSIVVHIRNIWTGIIFTLFFAWLLIVRENSPNISVLQVSMYLVAIFSGCIYFTHPAGSVVLFATAILFQLVQGFWWQSLICAILGIAVVIIDFCRQYFGEHFWHLSENVRKQQRGLFLFIASYGVTIVVFAILYGCLDAFTGEKCLKCSWINGEPHFSHYLLFSLMAIYRNPPNTEITSMFAIFLLSLEGLMGMFLFAVVLKELLTIRLRSNAEKSKMPIKEKL